MIKPYEQHNFGDPTPTREESIPFILGFFLLNSKNVMASKYGDTISFRYGEKNTHEFKPMRCDVGNII